METRLAMDSSSKELELQVKKKVQHRSGLELKVEGALNTVTAQGTGCVKLSKVAVIPLRRTAEEGLAAARGQGLCIALGAKARLADASLVLTLDAKQTLTLKSTSLAVRGRRLTTTLTQAVVKAAYEVEPRSRQTTGTAKAFLRHTVFDLLPDQDIRIAVGVAAPIKGSVVGRPDPYVKIQENCWALRLSRGAGWQVTYEL